MSKKRNKRSHTTRKNRTKRSWIYDIPIGVCIFFIAVGVLIAYVFGIGMWLGYGPVEKSEAIPISATYESYTISYGRGGINGASVYFSDREKLFIESAQYSTEVEEALDKLNSGDRVEILVHPVSTESIWDMRCGENVILSFDESNSAAILENTAFTVVVGIFGFIIAVLGVTSLALQSTLNRKRKKANEREAQMRRERN